MDQAEGIRNVIKLQNQQMTPKARVITITSGKGGVGKSSVAVNLAVQLRKLGKRVIIFDADLGLANVEVMFGAIPKYNLSDLIYQGRDIREIITPGPMDIGFISGGSGIVTMNNLTKDQISYLVHSLSKLDELADVILIDTGDPGHNTGAKLFDRLLFTAKSIVPESGIYQERDTDTCGSQ